MFNPKEREKLVRRYQEIKQREKAQAIARKQRVEALAKEQVKVNS
jgi:hypothetical protein